MVTLGGEYLLSSALLALPILGLPTLEEARLGRLALARPLLCDLHEFWRRHPELLLTESGIRQGKWWTLVSSMFVHMDPQHLLSNLESLLVAGFPAFCDLGPLGLYGIFFASGAAAGLNSRGRLRQAEAQLRLGPAPEQIAGMAVPEGARSLWDSVRHSTARLAAPVVANATQSLGASAGVCGLMGYGLASSVERLVLEVRGSGAPHAAAYRAGADIGQDADLGRVLVVLLSSPWLSLLQSGAFVLNEWRLLGGKEGRTGTDHSGHLTGFAAGLAAFATARAARWLAAWAGHRRRPDDDDPFERPRRSVSVRRYISGGRIVDG